MTSKDKAIVRRWKVRLAVRQGMLKVARRRHKKVPLRLAQVRAARSVIKRHSQPSPVTGVSQRGYDLIKRFEGFSGVRYNDGVGVQTIGYGTTAADVSPLPKSITKARAESLLRKKVEEKYYPPVARALAPFHPTQNMIDAAVSFAYNLGTGAFQGAVGFETLTRALHSKDERKIAKAFLLYDNPNSPSVHAGLKARRQTEHDLFLRLPKPIPTTKARRRTEHDLFLRDHRRVV